MIRIATALLLTASMAFASSGYELNIKSGAFTPAENYHSQWSQTLSRDYTYKVIQFNSIPTDIERIAMEGMGLVV